MSYRIAKPSAILAPYIKQYWMIENCLSKGEEHIQRVVPNGLMELSFYLEGRPEIIKADTVISGGGMLTGQLSKPYELRIRKKISLFAITFQPLGAQMFFNLPMSELQDLNIPLQLIRKDLANELESELYESGSFGSRIRITEQYLMALLKKNTGLRNMDRIQDSIRVIDHFRAEISIEQLSLRACLGRKQYERLFSAGIGISPKGFLRVVRFQRAVYYKQLRPDTSLTQLALECGYYDQSHMINDFKKLSGLTPREYFSDCEPYSDYFSI